MTIATVALVSIGAHPASGRTRRAEQDARAVELGLELVGDNLHVLHAGNPHEPALQIIPNQLQAQLDGTRVLLGATSAA